MKPYKYEESLLTLLCPFLLTLCVTFQPCVGQMIYIWIILLKIHHRLRAQHILAQSLIYPFSVAFLRSEDCCHNIFRRQLHHRLYLPLTTGNKHCVACQKTCVFRSYVCTDHCTVARGFFLENWERQIDNRPTPRCRRGSLSLPFFNVTTQIKSIQTCEDTVCYYNAIHCVRY